MLTFLRASCVYSIHVIAIHHKTSRKLKAFCFGYSQKLQCFRLRHPMLRVHRGCGLLGTNIFLFRLSDMLPSLKLTNRPWKLMVGRLLSFWDTIFSGAMLVSGRVVCWRVYYVYIYICSVWERGFVLMFLVASQTSRLHDCAPKLSEFWKFLYFGTVFFWCDEATVWKLQGVTSEVLLINSSAFLNIIQQEDTIMYR